MRSFGTRLLLTAAAACALGVLGLAPACAGPPDRIGQGSDPGIGQGLDRGSGRPAGDPTAAAGRTGGVESLSVRVLDSRPHATDAFTQGLLFHDGHLYESTGQRGRSTLRKVDPETGAVLIRRELPRALFGEGLARVPAATGSGSGDRLVQLTWQAGRALIWDLATLERVGEHRYDGEGWGLAFDGEHLVMSDGSSALTFRDPESFEPVSRLEVTLGGRPLAQLNELEWVDGALWANVWGSTTVVRIDPTTGEVTATADLTRLYGLLPADEAARIDVLNGIAYRPGAEGTFLVTGKYWPRLFEVIFQPRAPVAPRRPVQ